MMMMMMMVTVVGIIIYLLVDVEASVGPARGEKKSYIYLYPNVSSCKHSTEIISVAP